MYGCEVKSESEKSEKKVKKWKSEAVFGPLNLFNLRYIKRGVKGNNNIGIKSAKSETKLKKVKKN